MRVIKQTIKFLRPGLYIFSVAFLFAVFFLLYESLGLPSNNEVLEWLTRLFNKHGLIIVLLGSLIESLFMLSMYLPGSIVIVLSIAVLGGSTGNLFFIGILALTGFTISNIINYFLGRYGYYRVLLALGGKDQLNKMRKRVDDNINKTVALSAFHPNFLAITVVAAGIVGYKFWELILKTILANIAWITLWVVVFNIVLSRIDLSKTGNTSAIVFLALLLLWGLGVCVYENIKGDS